MIIQCLLCCQLGWWFVCTGQEEGWAPCSYLERVNGQEEDEEEDVSGSGKSCVAMVDTIRVATVLSSNE